MGEKAEIGDEPYTWLIRVPRTLHNALKNAQILWSVEQELRRREQARRKEAEAESP
jgi:hypothetical protein